MTKVPDNLSKLSDEKLEELADKVAVEALEAKEEARRISHEISRRVEESRALSRIEGMSEKERETFRQLLQANGIESDEKGMGEE